MSSHDSTIDGVIGLGAPGMSGAGAIGDPDGASPMQAESGSAGTLSLDEAESIAARRLRELAIRLGDDDSDDVGSEPGLTAFDADRHLSTRLARRMASLASNPDNDDDTVDDGIKPLAETGVGTGFVVSDALPLSAFGERLAALSQARSVLQPAPPATDESTLPVVVEDAGLPAQSAEEPGAGNGIALAPHEDASEAMPDSALRLVDLIREQRLLLDRLGRLKSLPLANNDEEGEDSDEPIAALPPPEPVRSDAEELFEAGTHAPDRERADSQAAEESSDSVSISAEQLIAALGEASPSRDQVVESEDKDDDRDEDEVAALPAVVEPFKPSDGVSPSLLQDLVDRSPGSAPRAQFMLHQPVALSQGDMDTGFDERPLRPIEERRPKKPREAAVDAISERPPIIIERARAEMTALANGAEPLPASQPSAAIGFFAGFSLSLLCGVALYYLVL